MLGPERGLRWARARLRQGWLSPLARLAGLAAVVALTLNACGPLWGLSRWALPESESRWLIPPAMGQPRWPLEGERTPTIASLPRAPGPGPVQVFQHMPGPPPPMPRMAFLLPATSGDDAHVFLNGVRLQRPAIATARPAAAPWSQAVLWDAPIEFLKPGPNRMEVLIVGSSGPALGAPMYLGPRDVLEKVADKEAVWGGAGRHRLVYLGLAACLSALLGALLDARRRTALLAAGGLAAAFAARTSLAEDHVVTSLGVHWGALDRLTVMLGLLCLTVLMAGRRPGLDRDPLGWVALAVGLASLLDFLAPLWAPSLASAAAWAVIVLPAGLLAVNTALSGGLDWRGSALRRAEAAAAGAMLLLIAVLIAWTGLGLHRSIIGLALDVAYVETAELAMLATILAAIWLGVAAGVRVARTSLDQSRIIQRQQAQIAAAATALEQEMRRATVLEERQRLARDMHDGVGGQLVSLIARVRTDRIDKTSLEGELMRSLAELRMVVDSLDATGQSLEDALLAFRLRAETQAEGAGMTLEWRQADLSGVETEEPRWVLTLYRFMQEAVTNAARHSGGKRLTIRIDRIGPSRLSVEVTDDGHGFDPAAAPPGKGLRNLGIRAAQLEGTLTIDSTARGTRVLLETRIPVD
jgi:signal transduction histidine kinase